MSGRLLRWLYDFLRDRNQRVLVDGAYSPWLLVEDGVPQGSVLSCLLFTLFIADMHDEPPHIAQPPAAPAVCTLLTTLPTGPLPTTSPLPVPPSSPNSTK